MNKHMKLKFLLLFCLIILLSSCTLFEDDFVSYYYPDDVWTDTTDGDRIPLLVLDDIPTLDLEQTEAFSGNPYTVINGGVPFFGEECFTLDPFEYYGDLDGYGRCTFVCANVCFETMPTEERGNIGQVKPTGWQISKYDFVDGKYLYNRCHLIGYQLTGENANTRNLITGTRYMNVDGMLPFENLIDDYIERTDNHVLYRVTPIFEEDNMLASGVLMEAMSVEDKGEGICFNVFCYNVQPWVIIDYSDGTNSLDPNYKEDDTSDINADYILNINSKKFHYPTCSSVADMKAENKVSYSGSRSELIDNGYVPCGGCKP